jgi:hypothetical protein
MGRIKRFQFVLILFLIVFSSIASFAQRKGTSPAIGPYSEGLAPCLSNGIWSYVDKNKNTVIGPNPQWRSVGKFSQGLAKVALDSIGGFKDNYRNYVYIDKSGKVAISEHFFKADDFDNSGFAKVVLNDARHHTGYIDRQGGHVTSFTIESIDLEFSPNKEDYVKQLAAELNAYRENSFSVFAKSFVERDINQWQVKGEFETIAHYKERVTAYTRQARIDSLAKAAEIAYVNYEVKKLKRNLVLKEYDAENQCFLVEDSKFGKLLVPVPLEEAPDFKAQYNQMVFVPKYFIFNDFPMLASEKFIMPNGKTYEYSNQQSLHYSQAKIDYRFDPIDINAPAASQQKQYAANQQITETKISVGKPDVDLGIPSSATTHDKIFAVIIANENYKREQPVTFAGNDGAVFKQYCEKTLGLPAQNVHLAADATLNEIYAQIDWLKQVTEAYEGEAKVIFYYAGHGIPDESTKDSYLLPVDGYGSNIATGYKVAKLYEELSGMKTKGVTVFMDACFSGATRSGSMMASARGVALKINSAVPRGNLVVFSAAQNDETAYPYLDHGHGLFTYFLLKKLKESSGNVTYKELGDYITDNVRKVSIVANSKSQTPSVIAGAGVGGDWQQDKIVE